MRPSQQEFITEAIEYLGLTKIALAIKFNTSVSIVNSWLTPPDRAGHQAVPDIIQEKINALIQDKKSASLFPIHAGTSAQSVPGHYCDKYQFHFPTLYRVRNTEDDQVSISYALSDQPQPGEASSVFEALRQLDPDQDPVWVFINEHSSMNAVLGYWRAISHSNPDPVSARFKLYFFEDHLFSIYHIHKPDDALLNSIVYYQIEDNEFQIAMPSLRRKLVQDWSLIIDSAGNERDKREIWRQ